MSQYRFRGSTRFQRNNYVLPFRDYKAILCSENTVWQLGALLSLANMPLNSSSFPQLVADVNGKFCRMDYGGPWILNLVAKAGVAKGHLMLSIDFLTNLLMILHYLSVSYVTRSNFEILRNSGLSILIWGKWILTGTTFCQFVLCEALNLHISRRVLSVGCRDKVLDNYAVFMYCKCFFVKCWTCWWNFIHLNGKSMGVHINGFRRLCDMCLVWCWSAEVYYVGGRKSSFLLDLLVSCVFDVGLLHSKPLCRGPELAPSSCYSGYCCIT